MITVKQASPSPQCLILAIAVCLRSSRLMVSEGLVGSAPLSRLPAGAEEAGRGGRRVSGGRSADCLALEEDQC